MFKRVIPIFFMILMVALSAEANVVLKIMATNPSEFEEQDVTVKSYLPRGTRPENVVKRGDLELAYDVRQNQYYVYKEVRLKPNTSISYEIEIEDIWLIDEERLNTFKSHTEKLVEKLKKTEYEEVSSKLKEMIEKNVAEILEKQASFAIDRVSPFEHIGAHEVNIETLNRVKKDVGTLENLIISLGENPGLIMGESSIGVKMIEEVAHGAGKGQGAEDELKKGKTMAATGPGFGLGVGSSGSGDNVDLISLKVEVENPSQTEVQVISVRHDLPIEIRENDVIDPGELELGFDFANGLYYLFKDKVRLDPGEKKVFEVLLKDKWSIKEMDLFSLKIHAENMIEPLRGIKEFSSTQQFGKDVLVKLDSLFGRKGVSKLTSEHISAFREDVRKLEDIKRDIQRMEQILSQAGVTPKVTIVDEQKFRKAAKEMGVSEARLWQVQKMREEARGKRTGARDGGSGAKEMKLLAGTIFSGKAPTAVTTWRIIFIIIGFLGVMSLLFFLRWHLIPEKKIERIDAEPKKDETLQN